MATATGYTIRSASDFNGSRNRGKLLFKRLLSQGSTLSICPGCAVQGWKTKHTACAVMGRQLFGSGRALQADRSDFNVEMELICLANAWHLQPALRVSLNSIATPSIYPFQGAGGRRSDLGTTLHAGH